MRATQTIAVLVVALAASPAFAEQAQSRDDKQSQSKGGETSREVGIRHTPSGPSAVPRSPAPPPRVPTVAEQRHPRAGTGTGYRSPGGDYYSGRHPYRYRSYPYDSYYGSYYGFYGRHYYYPYYGWGYWGPSYAGAYYYYDGDDRGALRLIGQPRETRVFVDGYYAGVIDDFDGLFQRLRLPPGRHEITLSLEGYRTQRLRVYVRPDQTTKIHLNLVPGVGEDAPLQFGEVPPEPDWSRKPVSGRWDDRAEPSPAPSEARSSEGARLELRVEPDDASVYVDGEFRGPARDAHSLELPPGSHRLEIVRPGYRTFDRELEVHDGPPTRVEARLERL